MTQKYNANEVDRGPQSIHRNSDVRNAVRKTRDRLAEQGISDPEFDADLLRLYARTVQSGTLAIVLLVVMTGFFGTMFGFPGEILVWAALTSVFYVGLGLLARRYLAQKRDARTLRRWTLTFAATHILLGACWAWFAFLACPACTGTEVLMFKAIVMLIAMAASATINYNLRWSVGVEFGLPIVAFAFAENSLLFPSAMAASAGLLATLLFFSFIAIRLRRASLAALSYRSENNALIAELEMARSISEEARRRAEDANLAKSRFIASMSHEIRNPLNIVLGYTSIINREIYGKIENVKYREYLHHVYDAGSLLLNLVNSIIDLSAIESGKYVFNFRNVNLISIIEDTVNSYSGLAHNNNIDIVFYHESGDVLLYCDPRSIKQIAINLISNSIKFTPEGGTICVEAGYTTDECVFITVEDNGIGIHEDDLIRILSPYEQASVDRNKIEMGNGLGLSIVQALLSAHNGKLKIDSRQQEGTKITVIIPLDEKT